MNLEKVFNFIEEKKGYDVPTLYKLLNDIPLPDDEKTEFINNLNSGEIYNLIYGSKEPDRIIDILLSSNEFINNLKSYGIHHLLYNSKEKDRIIDILLSTEGFINKLDSDGINYLFSYSTKPYKIIYIIRKYRPDIQLKDRY